jgi:TRAP transporter TAXI family solute receptor
MQQVNSEYNLWQRFVIPANTYEGQKNAVETIAQPNFLAVRSDVDADTVYLITKTIYENLSFLNNVHKATKTMALTKALNVLPMPLHPGAARYYREAGIAIPEKLVIE